MTEDEKALGRAQKSTDLLSALFRLTMTPDEYEEYKALTAEFGIVRMTGFLNKKIMDLGAYYDRAVFLEEGYEDVVEKARKFYESTFARDSHFVKEILSVMNGNGQEHAVFIAGGFHAPNLKSLFKRENLSYASIMPQVTQETNQKRYESILLSQRGASTAASIPAKPLAVNMDRPTNQGTLVLYPELFPGRRSVLPEIAASLGTSVDAYVSAFAGIDGARLALTRREMLQRTAGLAVLGSLPSMSAAQDEKTPENPFHEKDSDLGKQFNELSALIKAGKKPSADAFLAEYTKRAGELLNTLDFKKPDPESVPHMRFKKLMANYFLYKLTEDVLKPIGSGNALITPDILREFTLLLVKFNEIKPLGNSVFDDLKKSVWPAEIKALAEMLKITGKDARFRLSREAAVSLAARNVYSYHRKFFERMSREESTSASMISGFVDQERYLVSVLALAAIRSADEGREGKSDVRKLYGDEISRLSEASKKKNTDGFVTSLSRLGMLRSLVHSAALSRADSDDARKFLQEADKKILPLMDKALADWMEEVSKAVKKESRGVEVTLAQAAFLKDLLSAAKIFGSRVYFLDRWGGIRDQMRPGVNEFIQGIESKAIPLLVKHVEERQVYLKFNSFKRDGRETSLAEEIVRDVSGGIIYHYAQAILEHGKDPFDVIQLITDFEKKQGLGTVWELVRNADEKTRAARERLGKALREKGHALPGGARLADISRRQFLATGLTAATAGIVLGDSAPAEEIQELRTKIASALARKKDKEKELKSAQENAGRIYRQALFGAVTTSVAFEGALIPEDRRGKDGEKYDIAAAKKMGRIANRLDPAGMGAQADAVLVMANGKQHLFRNLSDISLRPRKRLEPELPADVAESLKGFPGDIQQRLRDHGYYKNEKGDVISLKLHTMVVSKKDHLPVFGWRERVNGYMLEYEFYDFPGNKDAALSKKTVEMLKQYALLGYVLPTWNEIPVHPDVAKLHLADRARRENRYDLFYRYLILTDPATGLTYRYHIEGHYLNPKKYDPGVPYLRTNDNPLKSRDYLVISGTQSFFRQRSMKIDIRGKIYDQVSYDAERALLSDEREFSPDGVPNLSRLIDTVGLSKPTEKDGFYFSRLYGDPSRPPYYKASQNWPNSDLFARAVSYEDVLWNGGVIIPYDRRGLERFERSNRLAKGDMSQYQSYIPQSYQRELLVGDSAIRLVGADRAKRGRDLSRDMNEADSQADKLRIGSEIRLLGPYQDPKFLPPIETFWHVDESWLGNTIPSPRHADSAVEKLKTEIDALNETIKESQKTLRELEKDGARLATRREVLALGLLGATQLALMNLTDLPKQPSPKAAAETAEDLPEATLKVLQFLRSPEAVGAIHKPGQITASNLRSYIRWMKTTRQQRVSRIVGIYRDAARQEPTAEMLRQLEMFERLIDAPGSDIKKLYQLKKEVSRAFGISYGASLNISLDFSRSPVGQDYLGMRWEIRELSQERFRSQLPDEARRALDEVWGSLKSGRALDESTKSAMERLSKYLEDSGFLEKMKPDYEKFLAEERQRLAALVRRHFGAAGIEESRRWLTERGVRLTMPRDDYFDLNVLILRATFELLPAKRYESLIVAGADEESSISYHTKKDELYFSFPDHLAGILGTASDDPLQTGDLWAPVAATVMHEVGHRWDFRELPKPLRSQYYGISWDVKEVAFLNPQAKAPEKGVIKLDSVLAGSMDADFPVLERLEGKLSGFKAVEDLAQMIEVLSIRESAARETSRAITSLRAGRPHLANKIFFAYGFWDRVPHANSPWIVRLDGAPADQPHGLYAYQDIAGKRFQLTVYADGRVGVPQPIRDKFDPNNFIKKSGAKPDGARLARTFHEGNFGRDYQAEVIKEGSVHKLVLSFNKDFGGLEVDDGNSKTSYHRIKIPIVSAGTYTMKDNIYGKSYIVTVKEDRKSKKFSIKVSENPDQPKRTASVKTQFVKKREAASSRRKPGFFFSIGITVSNEIRRILGFRNGRTTGDLRMGLEDSSDTDWDSGRKGRTGKRDRDGARLAASAKEVSQFRQLLREKLGKHYAVRADRMSVSDERIAAVIDAEDTRSAVRDLVGPLSPKGGIEPFVSLVERQRALHPKPKPKEDAAAPKPVPADLSLILSRDYGRSIEGAKKLLADTIDYLIAQGAPRPNLLAALKEDILAKGVQMNAGSINSSHSLTISKIFSQQQTLTAIEINAALLLTVQESLREQKDREGAAQYFIEYFGSLAAREAAGMQIMKFSPEWKKMFDNAAVFSTELTGYGIDISVRDPRAWNQAYFTRYSSEILSSVGRAVGLEVTEAEEKEKFLQWAAGKGLYTAARVDAFLSGSTGIYAETLKFLNFGVRHQTKPGREAKIEGALDTHIPANLYSVIANGRVTQLTEAVYLVFTYFEMSHNRLSAAAYLDERGKAVFAIRQRQTPQAFYTDLRLFKRTAENLLSTISSVADGDQAILNSAARLASEAGSAKEPDLGPDAASRAFFAGAGRLLPSADSKRRIALDLRVYDLTRNSGKVIVEGYGQPVVIDLESGSHQKVSESLKQDAVYNPDLTDRVMKLAEINAVGSPAFPPQAPFVVYLHDLDGQLTGVAQADKAKLANLLTHLSEKAVVILEGSDKAVALAREVIREKGIQNPGRFFTQVPADYEKTQAVHLISKHSYLNPIPAFAAKIAGIFSDHAQHYWLAMENDNQSGQTGVFAFGAIESMIEKIVSGDIEGAYAIFRQLYAATNAGEEPTLSDFQDFLKGDRSKIQRFAIRPILAKSLQEAYKMYQLEQAIRTNA